MLVLVTKKGRRVAVPVGVADTVEVNVFKKANKFVAVNEGVMVPVGDMVGVKTSLANSARVNALSVLIVGVGDPL